MNDAAVYTTLGLAFLITTNVLEYSSAREAIKRRNNPRNLMNYFERYDVRDNEGWTHGPIRIAIGSALYLLQTPGRELAIHRSKRKTSIPTRF